MECGAVALAICLSLPDLGPPLHLTQTLEGPARWMALEYRRDGTISHEYFGPVKLALGNTKHHPRLFRREKTAFLVVQQEKWTFLATPKTVGLVRRWELSK